MRRLAAMFVLVTVAGVALAQPPVNFNGIIFCIDPGHGGHNPANDRRVEPDPGIVFWESESNFQKALLLDTMLTQLGATVILTRYTNDYPNDNDEPTLAQRVAIANANNSHWFHSIHSNAFNGVTNYTLMLVRESTTTPGQPHSPPAWQMSSIMAPKIFQKMRTTAQYTRLDFSFLGFRLGVLSGLNMPGQLSEGSFHDVFPETRRLMNNDYRKMEMYALRDAFMQYYGLPADTLGIIAGIQTEIGTNRPINATQVRLFPEDRVYMGDNYNNGFYMFDNLVAGPHGVKFETPGFTQDSVAANLGVGATVFVDRSMESYLPPTIVSSFPMNGDTLFSAGSPITLQFSKVMNTGSVQSAFGIQPTVSGTFTWSQNNTRLVFTPSAVLTYYTYFTITIDTTAQSLGGQTLDGNGDGISGDPYILVFRTSEVDAMPPAIVNTYPEPDDTVPTPFHVINISFDEPLNQTTVSLTNFAVQEIGASLLQRELQYWQSGPRSGVNMYITGGLQPGKSYRVRVSGVSDMFGNTIPNTSPIIWQFSTAPGTFTTTRMDAFDTTITHWWQPGQSGSTVGVDSARFEHVTFPRLPGFTNIGSARLSFAWNTAQSNWLLRTYLASGPAREVIFRKENTLLQTYVHGDGSNTQFRFAIDDSVEAFPGGTAANHEVSRWYTVDWIGWRLVEWDLENDSVGTWLGNGILEGDLRFDSFQLRYVPGMSAANGILYFDDLQITTRSTTSVPVDPAVVPEAFVLHQNYPNPFNPSTTFTFDIGHFTFVILRVYDLLGREVATLVNEQMQSGRYEVSWDATGMASGIYVYRLETSTGMLSRKMMVVK
jgi:N-acetylmuramoyl-L-alanine amidase